MFALGKGFDLLTQVTAIVSGPRHPSAGVLSPGLNSMLLLVNLVTQHPFIGWADTSHMHGGLEWLDRQSQGVIGIYSQPLLLYVPMLPMHALHTYCPYGQSQPIDKTGTI